MDETFVLTNKLNHQQIAERINFIGEEIERLQELHKAYSLLLDLTMADQYGMPIDEYLEQLKASSLQ